MHIRETGMTIVVIYWRMTVIKSVFIINNTHLSSEYTTNKKRHAKMKTRCNFEYCFSLKLRDEWQGIFKKSFNQLFDHNTV